MVNMGAPIKTIISSKPVLSVLPGIEYIMCKKDEIDKLSFLTNNQGVIALVKIFDKELKLSPLKDKLILGLDGVQDPGNMGTIIRLANWFGISHILCSRECADVYNPKVVQASMGALLGVEIHYVELESVLDTLHSDDTYQVYGSFMEGHSIYSTSLHKNGILIMGNEGKGISDKISQRVRKKISIPAFYNGNFKAESLNVGVATGIILSEFMRQSS